jgi:outer membrane biosynthesis protein TonB
MEAAMPKSILEVHGIGLTTAKTLAENGIKTASDLAGKTINQVAALKGFSSIRAKQVITAARALIAVDSQERIEEKKKPTAKSTDKKKKKEIVMKEKESKKLKKAKKTVKAAGKLKKEKKEKKKKKEKKEKKKKQKKATKKGKK